MATKAETAQWQEFVEKQAIKSTATRRAIFDAFLRSNEHLTLEEIRRRARRSCPGVGLATVYRTMRLLEEAGVAKRLEFQDGTTRYESATRRGHHDHLICTACGGVFEFENDEIERLQIEVARASGFDLRAHRHELYGLCASCRPAGDAAGSAESR